MVLYRRNFIPGGSYFFTVTLRDRRTDLLVRHIDVLRAALRAGLKDRACRIDAMVVMPDHLHALWTLPPGDAAYSGRWRAVKTAFVRGVERAGERVERNARGEANIWQARFWEHTIRDEADFGRHADYIHYNPVKHGLVTQAADGPYSTIHRFVAQGIYEQGWGEGDPPTNPFTRER